MQEVENEDVDSGLKCLDVVEVTDREQNDSEEGKDAPDRQKLN